MDDGLQTAANIAQVISLFLAFIALCIQITVWFKPQAPSLKPLFQRINSYKPLFWPIVIFSAIFFGIGYFYASQATVVDVPSELPTQEAVVIPSTSAPIAISAPFATSSLLACPDVSNVNPLSESDLKAMVDEAISVWGNAGDESKAIQLLCTVIANDPNHYEAHTRLGRIYLELSERSQRQGNDISVYNLYLDSAAVQLEKAAFIVEATNAEYDFAHYNLGIVYHRKGFFDKGIESVSRAIDINPRREASWKNRGQFYVEEGSISNACKGISDLTEALRIRSNYAGAYAFLGRAYETLRDTKKARESYDNYARLAAQQSKVLEVQALNPTVEAARRQLEGVPDNPNPHVCP